MHPKTLAAAIERSISHNEIVTVSLSDLLPALRDEAKAAGDDTTADMADACLADIEGVADENNNDGIPQNKRVRELCGQIIDTAQYDDQDSGDVRNGEVWEMWGVRTDAYRVHIRTYRVHIRIDA